MFQVAETCQLAVKRIEWLHNPEKDLSTNPYNSVDPAPPARNNDIANLTTVLTNEALPLFDRYRAMFSLRNMGGPKAAEALVEGALAFNAVSVAYLQYIAMYMYALSVLGFCVFYLVNKRILVL